MFRVLGSSADINEADERGWTPLMHAAKSGNYAIAEALLSVGDELDMSRCSHCGHSAVDIAQFYRHKDVYSLLADFSTFTCFLYSCSIAACMYICSHYHKVNRHAV